jgi:hypothetical protein
MYIVSELDGNLTIFADQIQRQHIVFEVFGTDVDCAITHVSGWLQLQPVQSNDSVPVHSQNSSALLSSIHDWWTPWSALEVSVYASCNFTLQRWFQQRARIGLCSRFHSAI